MKTTSYNLITILGPTASGKTGLAALLANKFNGEIISADSRQVYRKMNIGTGKDLDDYSVEGINIRYHLIDVIDPGGEFNLFLFNKMFFDSFHSIVDRNKTPFLVGGTGLFLHSILSGYELNRVDFSQKRFNELSLLETGQLKEILLSLNPKLHNSTDLLVKERIVKAIMIAEEKSFSPVDNRVDIKSLTIGLKNERNTIKERITERLKKRLKNGMIEEVEGLIKDGITMNKLLFFGLEYKFIAKYIAGELSYDEMFNQLNSGIHNFSKRQMTWFRKMEKEGITINWIEGADYNAAVKIIERNYFV